MRVEPHRLGVDRNNPSEVEPFRQITAMKSIGHPGQRRAAPRGGAQEKTRTSTSFRPLEPESSASTNSATWAPREAGDKRRAARCQSTLPRRGPLVTGSARRFPAEFPATAVSHREPGGNRPDADRTLPKARPPAPPPA